MNLGFSESSGVLPQKLQQGSVDDGPDSSVIAYPQVGKTKEVQQRCTSFNV
jgi:hypothetical protein